MLPKSVAKLGQGAVSSIQIHALGGISISLLLFTRMNKTAAGYFYRRCSLYRGEGFLANVQDGQPW